MDKEKFGKFICELRKDQGMTQQDLGNKLHLTNKAISKWERGLSFPDVFILEKIAEILNVSVLELLKGERNTEINISNEVANTIIQDTVKHSGEVIKKIKRKFTIVVGMVIGLFPLILMLFSCICYFLIKDEKSLDDALLTLIFIIIAAIILLVAYGIPILGLIVTNIFYNSSLMNSNRKFKKIICISLNFVFLMWLLGCVIKVINNSI